MTEIEKQILSNQISIMGALGTLMNRPDITPVIHNMVTKDLVARTEETQQLYLKTKKDEDKI